MSRLNIKIGVGGRFHADAMTHWLERAGHNVKLCTTLPRSRFPKLASSLVEAHVLPEMLYRAAQPFGWGNFGDYLKMRWLDHKLSESVKTSKDPLDLLITWSSFGTNTLLGEYSAKRAVVRDSSHIIYQSKILEEEYLRWGLRFSKRQFCIDRELAEYHGADSILVLSDFAKKTFIQNGVPEEKLRVLRLGVDTTIFHPRLEKVLRPPLKVVFFGSVSVRKGIPYLLEATKQFSKRSIELYLAGPVEPVIQPILKRYSHFTLVKPMPHKQLSEWIRQMDVLVMPTLEDGFGQVVVQAMASGVVPITTNRCGAAELIRHGQNGLLINPQDANAIKESLGQLIQNPDLVRTMSYEAAKIRNACNWEQYGISLNNWVQSLFPAASPPVRIAG